MSSALGLPEKVRACLFDLDGVLTDTASVHNKAWAAMFDAYLADRAKHAGEKFVPFDPIGPTTGDMSTARSAKTASARF